MCFTLFRPICSIAAMLCFAIAALPAPASSRQSSPATPALAQNPNAQCPSARPAFTRLLPPEGDSSEIFGLHPRVHGDWIAGGSVRLSESFAGVLHVYRRARGQCQHHHQRLVAPDAQPGDNFGFVDSSSGAAPSVWDLADPSQVCETTQTMVIGLGGSSPSTLHLHVDLREDEDGNAIWQSVHRSPDPEQTNYDLFTMDAKTLAPIRSVNTFADDPTIFRYTDTLATKRNEAGEITENIPLTDVAMPDGPGWNIMVQALPWSEGLAFRAVMVDRWRGQGAKRAREGTWRVTERKTIETLEGTVETFRTVWQPDDGAFEVVTYVTASAPYYDVRVEYYPRPEADPLVSETKTFDAWCPPEEG